MLFGLSLTSTGYAGQRLAGLLFIFFVVLLFLKVKKKNSLHSPVTSPYLFINLFFFKYTSIFLSSQPCLNLPHSRLQNAPSRPALHTYFWQSHPLLHLSCLKAFLLPLPSSLLQFLCLLPRLPFLLSSFSFPSHLIDHSTLSTPFLCHLLTSLLSICRIMYYHLSSFLRLSFSSFLENHILQPGYFNIFLYTFLILFAAILNTDHTRPPPPPSPPPP